MNLALDFVLETLRCRLRAPAEADIPHVFSASRVPGFTDGMLWEPPETVDELYGPLGRNLAAWRSGVAYTFTVETKEFAFLGRVALRQTTKDRVGNLGFWTPIPSSRAKAT